MTEIDPVVAAAAQRLIAATVALTADIRAGNNVEDLYQIIGEDTQDLMSRGNPAGIGALLFACQLLIERLAELTDTPASEIASSILLTATDGDETA
jgi:hypothetical protein